MTNDRKKDHIDLALKSQLSKESKNSQFFYEPLFGVHPKKSDKFNQKFLGFDLDFPLWVSSMTGGTSSARACRRDP